MIKNSEVNMIIIIIIKNNGHEQSFFTKSFTSLAKIALYNKKIMHVDKEITKIAKNSKPPNPKALLKNKDLINI
jgi:hypothetical protein